jgi:hypothetical protein
MSLGLRGVIASRAVAKESTSVSGSNVPRVGKKKKRY